MRMAVHLLGGFRVTIDDHDVSARDWRRERGAALVKLLALSPGHRIHREQAMEALWPEMPSEASAANLRKALHFARHALGNHELIALHGEVLVLAPDEELVIDVEAFEAAANAALHTNDPVVCARAVEAYGGELLPDDRYVEWALEPRERLRQLYLRVLKAGCRWEQVLAVDPTDEVAQRELMQAALDAGNRGEVIRQFQRLRDRLRMDLGVGPSAATVAIYERALASEPLQPVSITDRVRASLAQGLVHLHSGELDNAEQIAREARQRAIEAGLGREVGEASTLLALVAHTQGRWRELFRAEFLEWIRLSPTLSTTMFEGHLCLAEFCLCGASGYEDIAGATRELLQVADRAQSVAGRAIAMLILGEAELFSGRMDTAEHLLTEADQLYEEMGAAAGRAIALQRLAEIALARGQRFRARRLVQRGFRLAETSWLAAHLLMRLQTLAIETARTPEQAAQAIRQGDRWLAERTMCQPCSMGFRVASAITVAAAGDPDQAGRRLDEAERIAGMWNGGSWVAAVWEGRAYYRLSQGNTEQAAALFREAAARYAELGRSHDERRCLARAGAA